MPREPKVNFGRPTNARSRARAIKWAIKHNMIIPRDYQKSTVIYEWSCGFGHKNMTSLSMLKKVAKKMAKNGRYRTPEHVCVHCDVEECQLRWPVAMKNNGQLHRDTNIHWECLMCNKNFSAKLCYMRGCPECETEAKPHVLPGSKHRGKTWPPHEDDAQLADNYGRKLNYMWRRKSDAMANITCVCGENFDMIWCNFRPDKGLFGCVLCKEENSRRPTREWAQQNGLLFPKEYIGNTISCLWTCTAGHSFYNAITRMRKIDKPAGVATCPFCEVSQIEWSREVTLLDNSHINMRGKLRNWSCNICSKKFRTTISKLSTDQMTGGCTAHTM